MLEIVESYLRDLGFHETEVRVYLALAEIGKGQAQVLSKLSGVARPTTYSVLGKLVEKGVVSVEKRNDTSFFAANPPSTLLGLIERKKKKLLKEERQAKELVQLMEPYFSSKHYSLPKLQFFEGTENVKSMLDNFVEVWMRSMAKYDDTLWGYQDDTFVAQHGEWLLRYWQSKGPQHRICLFSNKSELEAELRERVSNREIRVLEEDFQLTSTIWISGDYITMIMTQQEPQYGFQIHDAVFASNLRRIFQRLWQS